MNVSSRVICNTSLSYAIGPKNGVATNSFLFINVFSGMLAIVGNTMVLLAVYMNENLRRISNYFICSLAVADLVVGMIHIPFYTILMALHADSEGVILKIDFLLWLQVLFATTFNLCAVSIDRYIAVKMPLKYTVYMTERNCVRIIGLVWGCSVLFAFPAVFIDQLTSWSGYTASCSMVTLIIPLTIIIACYVEILKISRQQLNKIGCASNINTEERTNSIKNRKAVTTFAIITVFFIMAFTPNLVMAIWYMDAKDCKEERVVFRLWTMSLFVMHLSSSANPVIYGVRNKDFRTAFKRMYSYVFGVTGRALPCPAIMARLTGMLADKRNSTNSTTTIKNNSSNNSTTAIRNSSSNSSNTTAIKNNSTSNSSNTTAIKNNSSNSSNSNKNNTNSNQQEHLSSNS